MHNLVLQSLGTMGERLVMNDSLVTIYEEDIVEGGRVYKQSFLQLCSLEVADAGDYTCFVSNGQTSTNATTRLTVNVLLTSICDSDPCQNGGDCVSVGTCFQCECHDEFTGIACESGAKSVLSSAKLN